MEQNNTTREFGSGFLKILLLIVMFPVYILYILLFAGLEKRATIER